MFIGNSSTFLSEVSDVGQVALKETYALFLNIPSNAQLRGVLDVFLGTHLARKGLVESPCKVL